MTKMGKVLLPITGKVNKEDGWLSACASNEKGAAMQFLDREREIWAALLLHGEGIILAIKESYSGSSEKNIL